MYNVVMEHGRICVGIGGGSGSGKTWLATYLQSHLGAKCVVVSQDWYYRDNSRLTIEQSRKLNFDHPRAIETPLLESQLKHLLQGRPIRAPRYDYATHARLKRTRLVEPAPIVILEGLLVLHEKRLREHMDYSVYVDVPDDVRLVRRLHRDVEERRVDLKETLRIYDHCVRPMHRRFIEPSSAHATWVWRQLSDKRFPQELLKTIRTRLETLRPKP